MTPHAPLPIPGRGLRRSRRHVGSIALATAVLGLVAATSGGSGTSAAAPAEVGTPTLGTTTAPSSTTSPSSTTTTAASATNGRLVMAAAANVSKPAKRLKQAGTILFPMSTSPRCYILDNFGAARPGGRTHEGTDLLATLGQEVYAVDDGVLTSQYVDPGHTTLAGNAWTLTLSDKTYYFYAHLSRFADGLVKGSTVAKGQLIGYVGDTGDPAPTAYHLHFEVHPGGGVAVDPLPRLDVPAACTIQWNAG